MRANAVFPRVTFGIIVLNGEPFTKFNLRALYPYAHQIIVVEGASPNASQSAGPDGHSVDATLEVLNQFKLQEDPENKVTVVTAEDDGHPNGFWPGEKDEQSRAYARRATGNWLWQVDIDEFYRDEDIVTVLNMLSDDPTIAAVTFPEIPFWGSSSVRCDGIFLRLEYSKFHRLFAWNTDYTLTSHRPPTVVDNCGKNLREKHWLTAEEMSERGVYLYHYTQIFPNQVRNKMLYYGQLIESQNSRTRLIVNPNSWLRNSFARLHDPYRVHTVNTWPSWLVRYDGPHPRQASLLFSSIAGDQAAYPMRDMADVDDLLASRAYRVGIHLLRFWANWVILPYKDSVAVWRRRISVEEYLKRIALIAMRRRQLFPRTGSRNVGSLP